MRIVFVHGRAQEGKDPKLLKEEWEAALAKGLAAAGLSLPGGVDVRLPYYGDKLAELVGQLDAPLLDAARARGVEAESEDRQFRNDLLEEMRVELGIDASEVVAQYQGDAQERGPQNWEWVHSILKVLDSTPLGSPLIDAITRDVSVYVTNQAVQARIDGIVAPEVADEPCVVVGHSLGSVVGYNVLCNTPNRVVRYVTVGSPLGIKAIKRKLAPPLRMPGTTTSWCNAMDERDVVALRPLDAATFPITPAIANKTDVDNWTENRHGIAGYLSDAGVARWIAQGFGAG